MPDAPRVVVQLPEGAAERHRAVLQNVRNLRAALGVDLPAGEEYPARYPGLA